jgi:hypothetical protein
MIRVKMTGEKCCEGNKTCRPTEYEIWAAAEMQIN